MNETCPVGGPRRIVAVQWIARIRSIRNAMNRLAHMPRETLLVLPTTRTTLMLTRRVCATRGACVMAGPVLDETRWRLGSMLRTPAEIARELAGHVTLPRTVISFPDQLVGHDLTFAWVRFLGSKYAFSIIEALLALRHRPCVLGLRTCSAAGDFELVPVSYLDLLERSATRASLQALMERLLAPLEQELRAPPPDWLGRHWLALKSEAHWRASIREELKDLECLLRLHLLSPGCDRPRARAAMRAIVSRHEHLAFPSVAEE
jgi:hypothetical protein